MIIEIISKSQPSMNIKSSFLKQIIVQCYFLDKCIGHFQKLENKSSIFFPHRRLTVKGKTVFSDTLKIHVFPELYTGYGNNSLLYCHHCVYFCQYVEYLMSVMFT